MDLGHVWAKNSITTIYGDFQVGLGVGKGSKHACAGTQVHSEYHTTSPFSMGSFTMKIEPRMCGYYKSGLHPSNKLFTPCAQADLPLEAGETTYQIEFNLCGKQEKDENRYYE